MRNNFEFGSAVQELSKDFFLILALVASTKIAKTVSLCKTKMAARVKNI